MHDAAKYHGCLLGLAVGDALGTTLEFCSPGTFKPIHDMVGGGPFRLEPGQWTDDTSMELCLAESLIERQGFDAQDQMKRYIRWWREGHLSSTGRCFDIGNTVRAALMKHIETGEPYAGSEDEMAGGNGSLMRLAPVPMAYASNPEKAIELADDSSKTTHGAMECVDACRYFAGLLVGALHGEPKQTLLSDRYTPVARYWTERALAPRIDAIARGSYKGKEPPDIYGTGYVVDCLEAALWAFNKASSFDEGCLLAVNLGDDADTTGAVYGQIAGAYCGLDGIPERWLRKLALRDSIERFANALFEMAFTGEPKRSTSATQRELPFGARQTVTSPTGSWMRLGLSAASARTLRAAGPYSAG